MKRFIPIDGRISRKTLIAAFIALIAILALVYVFRFKPIKVTVVPVSSGPIKQEAMGTGTFEARFQATVSPKIQGRIIELLADQNDSVKEGQLLTRLDDTELRQEVGVAVATLDAAKATVERAKADQARAEAVLEQAKRDYERYSSLQVSKSVSQETVDKSTERLEIAQAELAKTVAAIAEAERQALMAEEKLRAQETRLADTRILSPFDGVIVKRDRELGDIVIPGASIFQLISLKEMWVSAWVDESAINKIAVDQPARIVYRSEPKEVYPGSVARVAREVDRETREFKTDVKAEVLPKHWAVGQRAEVYIQTGSKPEALSVPLKALAWRNGKPGVFIFNGSRAELKPIKIGLKGIDKIEATSGLSAGDQVILNHEKQGITDGRRVTVK